MLSACANALGQQDVFIFMRGAAPGEQDASMFACASVPGEQDV